MTSTGFIQSLVSHHFRVAIRSNTDTVNVVLDNQRNIRIKELKIHHTFTK
jgi:hypothetical protein